MHDFMRRINTKEYMNNFPPQYNNELADRVITMIESECELLAFCKNILYV